MCPDNSVLPNAQRDRSCKATTRKMTMKRSMSRSVLALGLLIALSASADAATLRHPHTHHVLIRPNVASSFAAVRGWAYAPAQPPLQYDAAPSYDDPSKFGGGTALPVQ
jgi:hypothetical protein